MKETNMPRSLVPWSRPAIFLPALGLVFTLVAPLFAD
jgi:hypothetical protein